MKETIINHSEINEQQRTPKENKLKSKNIVENLGKSKENNRKSKDIKGRSRDIKGNPKEEGKQRE